MTVTARFLLLSSLAACSDDDQGDDDDDVTPTVPVVCDAGNNTQVSTPTSTEVVAEGCGSVSLGSFEVLGEGTFTVDLFSNGEQVIPHVVAETDGSVFRGLVMTGRFDLVGDAPLRLWPLADEDGVRGIEDLTDTSSSPWAGLVGHADGASALVGVHSGWGTRFRMEAATDGTVRAVWGDTGEALPLDAGNEWFLDPLFVWVGSDPVDGWLIWSSSAAATASVPPPEAPPPPSVVVRPSEGDGPAELTAAIEDTLHWSYGLQNFLQVTPPKLVLIEEGWEQTFPGGMGPAAAEIAAAGLIPGISFAPFAVDPEATVVADHPDWWVTDAGGTPIETNGLLALDVTQTDAAAWMQANVAERVTEGWKVMVLDHLSVGAVEGTRNVAIPGTAAYRSGLSLVRTSAGTRWLVAADAPLLPSVGLVDACRGETGSLVGRAFLNGVWWWNEAGAIDDQPLSGGIAAAVAAGGSWGLPSPWEAGSVSAAFDSWSVVAGTSVWVPVDPLANVGVPSSWATHPVPDGTILLNLSDEIVSLPLPSEARYEVISGAGPEPGDRTLSSGEGEIWAYEYVIFD